VGCAYSVIYAPKPYKEIIEDNADDEVQRGDFGEFAEDDSASEPEEYEIFETESDPESDEFHVNCASYSYITDIVSGQPTWLLPLFNF
jgi:hypothetical protein